ncbi:hypothetical protein ACFL96_17105 [Thermoproteota archaeon]
MKSRSRPPNQFLPELPNFQKRLSSLCQSSTELGVNARLFYNAIESEFSKIQFQGMDSKGVDSCLMPIDLMDNLQGILDLWECYILYLKTLIQDLPVLIQLLKGVNDLSWNRMLGLFVEQLMEDCLIGDNLDPHAFQQGLESLFYKFKSVLESGEYLGTPLLLPERSGSSCMFSYGDHGELEDQSVRDSVYWEQQMRSFDGPVSMEDSKVLFFHRAFSDIRIERDTCDALADALADIKEWAEGSLEQGVVEFFPVCIKDEGLCILFQRKGLDFNIILFQLNSSTVWDQFAESDVFGRPHLEEVFDQSEGQFLKLRADYRFASSIISVDMGGQSQSSTPSPPQVGYQDMMLRTPKLRRDPRTRNACAVASLVKKKPEAARSQMEHVNGHRKDADAILKAGLKPSEIFLTAVNLLAAHGVRPFYMALSLLSGAEWASFHGLADEGSGCLKRDLDLPKPGAVQDFLLTYDIPSQALNSLTYKFFDITQPRRVYNDLKRNKIAPELYRLIHSFSDGEFQFHGCFGSLFRDIVRYQLGVIEGKTRRYSPREWLIFLSALIKKSAIQIVIATDDDHLPTGSADSQKGAGINTNSLDTFFIYMLVYSFQMSSVKENKDFFEQLLSVSTALNRARSVQWALGVSDLYKMLQSYVNNSIEHVPDLIEQSDF